MTHPAVIFGGPSDEHDISVSTGLQVVRVLSEGDKEIEAIYWDLTGRFHLVDPRSEVVEFADGPPRKGRELSLLAEPGAGFMLKRKPLDLSVVVNCCHGGPGEDGTLQGALDLAGLRYTGTGQAGSALGMDKLSFSAAVAQVGLESLPRVLLEQAAAPSFDPPYIVKPRFGGSSIGIEVVEDHATALALLGGPHMRDGAVLEPFLPDCRDLQLAVRTYPSLEHSAIEEPMRAAGGLYSYRQKYLAWGEGEGIARKLPAPVTVDLDERIRSAAKKVAAMVGVRGIARIDFLERGGELWVNEINTIPGSMSTYLWIDPPRTRAQLLADMVAEATALPPRRFSTTGADGTALRNAGSLASKLG